MSKKDDGLLFLESAIFSLRGILVTQDLLLDRLATMIKEGTASAEVRDAYRRGIKHKDDAQQIIAEFEQLKSESVL